MKQRKTITKIILILITFFLIACCIKTTSYAVFQVETQHTANDILYELNKNSGTGQIKITNSIRKNNNTPVFCREHTAILPDSGAIYRLDSTFNDDNKKGEKKYTNDAVAYILSASRNGYIKSDIQNAYWDILGYNVDHTDESEKLVRIAKKYQEYKTYKEIPVTVQVDSAQNKIEDNTIIYGPIKITYSYLEVENAKFGGFDFAFFDDNEQNINSSVELCMLQNGNYQTVNSKMNTNNYNQVRTADYSGKNLYLKIDLANISKITMKVKNNELNITATVYQIEGQYKYDYETQDICLRCEMRLKSYDPNYQDLDKLVNGNIVKRGSYYYEFQSVTTSNTEYIENKAYNQYNFANNKSSTGVVASVERTKYQCPYGSLHSTTYMGDAEATALTNGATHFAKNHFTKAGEGYGYVSSTCDYCGDTITEGASSIAKKVEHAKQHIKILKKYIIKTYNFSRYQGCENGLCGHIISAGEYHDAQKLSILWAYNANKEGMETQTEIPLIPSVDITLQKYNSYIATNKTPLTGAEFSIIAKQDGETIFNGSSIQAGETKTIQPNSYNPIYITIQETNAPSGYTTIKEPINVKYKYQNERWDPVYQPNETEWGTTGFKYGGWTWIDDGNTNLPNDYKSASGDIITVSQVTTSDTEKVTINVYNEPVIEKIVLSKIDEIDNSKLPGISFRGTITNVESIEGLFLTQNDDGSVRALLRTNQNGEIVLTNLKLIDENAPVTIKIEEIIGNDYFSNTDDRDYYYKVLTHPIEITITHTPNSGLTVTYKYEGTENVQVSLDPQNKYAINITVPNKRLIDVSGKVWLDGQTGIKPAKSADGIMGSAEQGVPGVIVELLDDSGNIVKQFNNTNATTTDATYITLDDGEYKFIGIDYGKTYTVRFTYDGINYEDTLYNVQTSDRNSDAEESNTDRNNFNAKFETITYKQAKDGTKLEYTYSDGKSILNTTNSDKTAKTEFRMSAKTINMTLKANTNNIDLGLVKRGTDLAISTDVYNAEVSINGQTTNYTYNKANNSIEIGNIPTSDTIAYNLNLYASDYNYRIRDYIANETFTERNYMNEENPGVKTGDELKVYVIYELNLQNQTSKKAYINEVQYLHDSRYTFKDDLTKQYNQNNKGIAYSKVTESNNLMKIDFGKIELGDGETKTLYLVFEASLDTLNDNKNGFENSAEITSYSTNEGLIDVDSQPGNYLTDKQMEDDCDKAGGLTIDVITDQQRKISGYVFDENNNKVDDIIVQLIELKEVNGKMYEYIWQETVSGKNTVTKLTDDGKEITTYTNNVTADDKGKYEFQGFIPGDYIVRFIYGDGTTYDMTGNVMKYNGQDYKSMVDSNYGAEWYNTSTYGENTSVARDNEARRLETMAYSVNVDAQKGILLKLLDNVQANDLNKTEKETLISIYNELYDPDITEVTDEIITNLLKEQVLPNTWMCAETSKIKIAVDTENATNIATATTVDGKNASSYIEEITNINLGLAKRPETKIELKKYITGFKLTASNGQVLVNARVDVNKYLDGTENISDEVQGIKNNVTILGTVWQYEVSPTEVNTVVEGAKLEYEYTLVVRNTGEQDNLSKTLVDKYKALKIENYETYLKTCSSDMKKEMRTVTSTKPIGTYLGTAYYTQKQYTSGNVETEVTRIRDYLNNDLEFISGKDMSGNPVTEGAQDVSCRILRDDYSTQDVIIKQTLETSATGKMAPNGNAVLYTVTLGRNPISSTGAMSFENYIAEVMSYTNAAGRRTTTSTPGNAEIIDAELREGRAHEIDEADTGRIQMGVKTGEDEETNYILITAIAAGIVLIAIGAFVTKKYIIK